MQPHNEYGSSASSPYERAYCDPYTYRQGDKKVRGLFASMGELLKICARPAGDALKGDDEREFDESKPTLDMAIILPGTPKHHGFPSDGQFLPNLAVKTERMCKRLGLNFRLRSRVSWQVDDRNLSRGKDWTLNNLPSSKRDDLKRLCKLAQGNDPLHDEAALCARVTQMHKAQEQLLAEARDTLANFNLIVIGTPNDNQVMANLCDIILTQHKGDLAELGMFVLPAIGMSPLVVRVSKETISFQEYSAADPNHQNIGWVHMIRSPWSSENKPRFLIYVGGFNPQGTIAAMRKRVQISETLVEAIAKKTSVEHLLLSEFEKRPDYNYRIGVNDTMSSRDPDRFIPAHIVEADIDMPGVWFLESGEPGRYIGNIESDRIRTITGRAPKGGTT